MYTQIKAQFEQNQNREYALKEAKYMRNKFKFYGIVTPTRRSIYKDFLKAEKLKKVLIGIFWINALTMNTANFNI